MNRMGLTPVTAWKADTSVLTPTRHDDSLIRGDGDVVMDAAETPWFNLVVVEIPAKLLQVLGDLSCFNRFDPHDPSQYTRKLPKTDSHLQESDTQSSAIFQNIPVHRG